MTSDSQPIFEAALALPEHDRALLAERLLETLSSETEELSDDDLLAELQRRRAEVQADSTQGIPWSQLKNES